MTQRKPFQRATGSLSALALFCWLGVTACDNPSETAETTEPVETAETIEETTVEDTAEPAMTVTLADAEAPNGQTTQQLALGGPESAVLVTCDQEGFIPFTFTDLGVEWVGCEVPNPGDAVGPESSLSEPSLDEVPSPVGGTVQQLTLPGPQSGVMVTCNEGFAPFIYEDQGTWVGCQAAS